ncbi:hypothetical protein D3C85_967250 [compost metagenome]
MEAIPLNQFNTINIADGKEVRFDIQLIKDNKFGVKLDKNDKDIVKFNVDAHGKLQIELISKDRAKANSVINLLIYATETKELSLNNATSLDLNAKGDSITLNLNKVSELTFDRSSQFTKLKINAEDGNAIFGGAAMIHIEKEITKSLYLNLKNTNFISEWASYQNLNITANGQSSIGVRGDDREKNKEYSIQNLSLQTFDEVNLNFEKIKIRKATGSLSDQTIVQMPVANLKQMLK